MVNSAIPIFFSLIVMHLGIDPGTVNIGVAITDDSGKLICSCVLNQKELGGITKAVEEIDSVIATVPGDGKGSSTFGIERFVAYKGQHSKASEEILMLIGALVYHVEVDFQIPIKLFRAIEWKPALCKYLVKVKGFSNPSTSFDKKYSRAAAECITGQKVKTDHEADAICLSYMWKVYEDKA